MKALTPIEYWHMTHASNGNCALSDEILESGQWDVCVQDALVLRGLVANIYCEECVATHGHITPLGKTAIVCYQALHTTLESMS